MVVTYLVARACDRDWPDGLSVVKAWLDGHHPDEEDEHGNTLLISAAHYGNLAVVRELLSRGATANFRARQPDCWTPLMFASRSVSTILENRDFIDIVRLLIAAGADVNARDGTGASVLMKAVRQCLEMKIPLILLRAGAIYDLRDLEGCDAEKLAVDWRREAQFLLADIRLAGGFKKYRRQPIVDLNVLRLLCEQWRAIAPSGVLARLFHGPLPKELFVHVLSFWRSARALDQDRGGDRQRLLALPPPWSTGG